MNYQNFFERVWASFHIPVKRFSTVWSGKASSSWFLLPRAGKDLEQLFLALFPETVVPSTTRLAIAFAGGQVP